MMGISSDTALLQLHTPSTELEVKLSGTGIAQEPPGTNGQRRQYQEEVLMSYRVHHRTKTNDTELAKGVPHSDCGAICYLLLP